MQAVVSRGSSLVLFEQRSSLCQEQSLRLAEVLQAKILEAASANYERTVHACAVAPCLFAQKAKE